MQEYMVHTLVLDLLALQQNAMAMRLYHFIKDSNADIKKISLQSGSLIGGLILVPVQKNYNSCVHKQQKRPTSKSCKPYQY